MSSQFRSLALSELTRESGGYTDDPPDGLRWVGEEGAKYCGWKAVDGAQISYGWRRLSRENWIASIPARHGSNFYRGALNSYDRAGCSISYIQYTTHLGALQALLHRLDPDILTAYLPGWSIVVDGRHPVLSFGGEVVDQIAFRHLSFVEAIHRLAVESNDFEEICRGELVRRLGRVAVKFGDRFSADPARLAIAHDLGCNRGITGAYTMITRLRGWEGIDPADLRDQLIGLGALGAARLRYTYDAAQEAP